MSSHCGCVTPPIGCPRTEETSLRGTVEKIDRLRWAWIRDGGQESLSTLSLHQSLRTITKYPSYGRCHSLSNVLAHLGEQGNHLCINACVHVSCMYMYMYMYVILYCCVLNDLATKFITCRPYMVSTCVMC